MILDTSSGNKSSANSTVVSDDPLALGISSALSALGDAVIIVSVLGSQSSRQIFTVRLIFFLACADFIGQMPLIGSFPVSALTENDGFWCTLQAAGNWYSAMSTWLWTMMYAYAVHRCFDNASAFPSAEPVTDRDEFAKYMRLERRFHLICWGLPLLVVSVTAGTGQFGHGYGGGAGSTCGFLSPTYALFPESLLWLALLYNVYSFAAVHRLIRRALRNIGAADLEPQARRELERRMRLWPRFVLYVLSFVCSQAPGALRTILVKCDAPAAVWPPLNLLASALCPLHGFLNSLIYGFTTRRIRASVLRLLCCGRCGADAIDAGDAHAPLVPSERVSGTEGTLTRLSTTGAF